MRKRVSLFPVLAVMACITVGFLWLFTQQDAHYKEVDALYQEACKQSNELEISQNKLKDTLASVNTEAFIENQARTLYGYMKPDELRLVITNPEVLYGTSGH